MNAGTTVEQFVQDCFLARTASLKKRLEIHGAYWRRFFHDECIYNSRRGVIARSESEKIVSVFPSNLETDVITTGAAIYRLRYHVKSVAEGWMIREVDTECHHCISVGKSRECPECGGNGWLNWERGKLLSTRLWNQSAEQSEKKLTGLQQKTGWDNRNVQDKAVADFMADNFRARIESGKRENEIHANYARRFYDPECDWTRWGAPVERIEAEKILSVEQMMTEARVVTVGSGTPLRYRLRPTGQSWLIWDVSMGCLHCYEHGRSASCFWCGGSLWDRKKCA